MGTWVYEGALHSDGADASGVVFDPAGNTLLTADDVQAVLDQADVLLKAAADATTALTTVVGGKAAQSALNTEVTNRGNADTALGLRIDAAELTANKNQAGGYAGLDGSSKVPSILLPSYVDDVLEFVNLAAFPATGETGKIYVALDTDKEYRWSGSAYREISPSPGTTDSLAEGTVNKYYTDARADARVVLGIAGKADLSALNAHINDTTDAHAASALSYDAAYMGLPASNLKTVLDAALPQLLSQADDIIDLNNNKLSKSANLDDLFDTDAALDNLGVTDLLALKADLVAGLVPASQLPSYVDDVLEFSSLLAFPATGVSGKIYVALDTNLTYRWTGSTYGALDPSLALGETSLTAYRGDRGKTAYDHSQVVSGNPHGVTAAMISAQPSNSNLSAIAALAPPDGYIIIRIGGVWTAINATPAALGAVAVTTYDAKGDLLVGTANDVYAKLAAGSNNQMLVADSSKASGLRYADLPRGGPRKMTSGLYYGPGVHNPSTGGFSQDIPNCVSFVVPEDTTFDRIACECIVGVASSVIRLGILANDPTADTPLFTSSGLILDAGTASTATAGAKEIVINQLLPAGTYWLFGIPQIASGATFRNLGNSDPLIGQSANTTTAGQGVNCYQLNTTTGAMPATPPSIISRTVGGMKIVLRKA